MYQIKLFTRELLIGSFIVQIFPEMQGIYRRLYMISA